MANSETMPRQWESANSECPKVFNQIVNPDTFVQIESHCFKDLVQKLTGLSENSEAKKHPVTRPARNSKKDGPAEGTRSVWNGFPLVKSGYQVGIQKPAFKLQDRRTFQRKLQINLGLKDHHFHLGLNECHDNLGLNDHQFDLGLNDCHDDYLGLNDHHKNLGLNDHCYAQRLAGNSYGISCGILPALICSPVTPLGPVDPFNSPSYYDSTPTSCSQSLCLEEEEEKFCFEGSAISVKREPELLPLFPLHPSTESSP